MTGYDYIWLEYELHSNEGGSQGTLHCEEACCQKNVCI